MIRYPLILCLGLLAAACVGPAPVAPPPPPPPTEGVNAVRALAAPASFAQVCDPTKAESFVSAVQLLNAGYNPAPGHGAYHPPAGSAQNWSPAISDDLLHAFEHAPPFFRQYLCGLNGIYINASACPGNDPTKCGGGTPFDGWGFRSRAWTDLGDRYIAISATLWPKGGSATKFGDYETQVLRSFLPAGDGAALSPSANSDDTWMTVLAALAHEVGHVVWAETTIPSVGNNYDFTGLIGCPAGDFFVGWAYNTHDPNHKDLAPKGRWRKFNDHANEANSYLDHRLAPSRHEFDDLRKADSALAQLLQPSQPWASLFGAQTADEDFVESYVMAVLTGYDPSNGTFAGPLTSLPLSFSGGTGPAADVAADLVNGNKPALANKIRCIPL